MSAVFAVLLALTALAGCGSKTDKASPSAGTTSSNTQTTQASTPQAVGIAKRYRSWAKLQTAKSLRAAKQLRAAVAGKDLAAAQTYYVDLLVNYESMRPAAEAFPDLDRSLAAAKNEVDGSEFSGLRKLQVLLFKSADWRKRQATATQTVNDLVELKKKVADLSLDGRAQVRAASHMLSDIQRYDLSGSSERLSHKGLQIAQARMTGVMAIWRALQPAVSKQSPDLANAVDRDLIRAMKLLDEGRLGREGSVRSRELAQAVDLAANSFAEVAVRFPS